MKLYGMDSNWSLMGEANRTGTQLVVACAHEVRGGGVAEFPTELEKERSEPRRESMKDFGVYAETSIG